MCDASGGEPFARAQPLGEVGGTVVKLDPTFVRESLRRLSATKADIFGAKEHHFLLNSPLAEVDVCELEHRHNIKLPDEYRHFLIAVGNGGAGPDYGVFSWGNCDGGDWSEADGFVGILSEPFPFAVAWNDLQGKPPVEPHGNDEEEREYEKQYTEFERRYFDSSLVNGAVPICHQGCALRIWLVLTGEQTGRLWRDSRADYTGLAPLLLADGSPATFSLWYNEWLENALQQAQVF
jgi:hypothetical protein